MAWTTDDLLSAVRRAAFLPDVSDQSDADLLEFADEALATLIAATIRPGREGYWLANESIAVTPGTREYTVPRRALGKTVRGVMAYRPDGTCYPLTPEDPIRLREFYDGSGMTADPSRYSFEESTIRLDNVSATSGWSLRVFFLRTPPKLILTSAASVVITPNYSGDVSSIELGASPPSTLTTAGLLVDVVAGVEPYYARATDLVVNVYNNPEVVLTTDITGYGIASYNASRQPDYMCPAETTVYPPITRTLWSALVLETASRVLQAVRDPQAESMMVAAERARDLAAKATTPRDDRRSKSIIGASALRMFPRFGRWPR